jgi:hypothetical protein
VKEGNNNSDNKFVEVNSAHFRISLGNFFGFAHSRISLGKFFLGVAHSRISLGHCLRMCSF